MSSDVALLKKRGELELALFIEEVRDLYGPVLLERESRIQGGRKLNKNFDGAVRGYCANPSTGTSHIGEFVNEMAVASVLAVDDTLFGPISYEPNILPSGREIDFVATCEQGAAFIEVKSIRPRTSDTEEKWDQYLNRSKEHTVGTEYVVAKDALGGPIYGDSFTTRSKFLEYTCEFEKRLEEALQSRSGHGILVFCGTGFEWRLDELEDFADFYLTGKHRHDDPFAKMEAYSLEDEKVELKRNIAAFAYLERSWTSPAKSKFRYPVRGPAPIR